MKRKLLAILIFSCITALNILKAQNIYTVAGTGTIGYSGDGGQATSAEIFSPSTVTFDAVGNYYIADEQNDVIRKVATNGVITTVAGTGGVGGFSGDGGLATSAQMNWTICTAFDVAGNMYISDRNNNRIRKVNTGGIISTYVGTGTPGYNGDGIPATTAEISSPRDITVYANCLYISDQGNNRIRKVDLGTGIITTVAGTGTASFGGDGGLATSAQINAPYGVTFDTHGNMFIGDQSNYCVREVANGTGIITTVAGMGGLSGFSGDGGPATSAKLNAITGIAVGSTGNIYIADTQNNRIRKVTKSTGIITTIIGFGTPGFSGDGGPAITAQIHLPNGVTLHDSCGDLYFPDWANQRIRKIVGQDASYTITGNTPVCPGISDTLRVVSPGAKYKWYNGDTTSSIIVNPVIPTTYSVEIKQACGGGPIDTSITIGITSGLTLNISSPSDTICTNQSITLTASGAKSYSWAPASGLSCVNCSSPVDTPKETTTYTVTGIGANGCKGTKTISIAVGKPPILEVTRNQTICAGDAVILTANALSGLGGTYNWQPGGSSSASLTIFPNSTTTYTVNYTTACGITSSHVTINVEPAPAADFNTNLISGCAPLCIQFKDLTTLSGGKLVMWKWAFGNGDTLNEESPIYCYPDTGNFTVSLTAVSNYGCSATLKIVKMISVYSKPVANFLYSPQPVGILEPTVQFTDKSTDRYGIAYRWWNFGDGTSSIVNSNEVSPTYTYKDTGYYCPQLIVMNNKGCMDSVTECLFVEPLFTLYIPSAFSPNGDGLNEVFEAKGTYIKSFEMYIFDRWGMELFHSTNINHGWDGTVKGSREISQEDSYVYKILATDWSNTPHSYVGEVTLLK